jgi:hypothetical protein
MQKVHIDVDIGGPPSIAIDTDTGDADDGAKQWTKEEKSALMAAVKEVDPDLPKKERWKQVAAFVVGRDKKDCYNYYSELKAAKKLKRMNTNSNLLGSPKSPSDGANIPLDEAICNATIEAFAPLGLKKPKLKEKVLARPPFRFLHDLLTAVMEKTGMADGLFSGQELDAESFEGKPAKIAYLQKAVDFTNACTGNTVDVSCKNIIAGTEAEKTNEFLQAWALLAVDGAPRGAAAVQQVLMAQLQNKDAAENNIDSLAGSLAEQLVSEEGENAARQSSKQSKRIRKERQKEKRRAAEAKAGEEKVEAMEEKGSEEVEQTMSPVAQARAELKAAEEKEAQEVRFIPP